MSVKSKSYFINFSHTQRKTKLKTGNQVLQLVHYIKSALSQTSTRFTITPLTALCKLVKYQAYFFEIYFWINRDKTGDNIHLVEELNHTKKMSYFEINVTLPYPLVTRKFLTSLGMAD